MNTFRLDVHHFFHFEPSAETAEILRKLDKMDLTQNELLAKLGESNEVAMESLALVRKVKVDVATLKSAIENGGPVKPEVAAALAALNETLGVARTELTALDAETDDPVTP